ncbi:MAG TPA: hypothetical protein VGM53_15105 [Streptosporangiaceae bacterium]|jgi:hypothetical protein
MTLPVRVIVQLAPGGQVDRQLAADPPLSLASGVVVLEHEPPGPDGRLGPPPGGQVVLSVLSPEALTREPEEVNAAVSRATDPGLPPVIIVEAAEELREEHLAVLVSAAERADRVAIVRIIADA